MGPGLCRDDNYLLSARVSNISEAHNTIRYSIWNCATSAISSRSPRRVTSPARRRGSASSSRRSASRSGRSKPNSQVQLFRRKPRGVELTQAGQALFAEAQAILRQVDARGYRHPPHRARRSRPDRARLHQLSLVSSVRAASDPRLSRSPSAGRAEPRRERHRRTGRGLARRSGSMPPSCARRLAEAWAARRRGSRSIPCSKRRWWWRCPPGTRAGGPGRRASWSWPIWRRRPSSSTGGRSGPAFTIRSSRPASAPGSARIIGQETPRMLATLSLVAAGLGVSFGAAIDAPAAGGRRCLPGARRRCRSGRAAQPRLPPRRELGRGAALHRAGPADAAWSLAPLNK